MPIRDAVATVLTRNAFYRDGYRFLIRVCLIQACVIALLAASLVGMIVTTSTKQVYFATTSNGRIIPLAPLSDPYRTNAEITAWAAKTAKDVMRFGYFDYQVRLDEASSHFTKAGWDTFYKALTESGTLDAITKRKLTVTLSISTAPEITATGIVNGAYAWDVRFPVSIKFDGTEPPQPINTMLKLRIVRVPNLQSPEGMLQFPDGIGIESWIASAAGINSPAKR